MALAWYAWAASMGVGIALILAWPTYGDPDTFCDSHPNNDMCVLAAMPYWLLSYFVYLASVVSLVGLTQSALGRTLKPLGPITLLMATGPIAWTVVLEFVRNSTGSAIGDWALALPGPAIWALVLLSQAVRLGHHRVSAPSILNVTVFAVLVLAGFGCIWGLLALFQAGIHLE